MSSWCSENQNVKQEISVINNYSFWDVMDSGTLSVAVKLALIKKTSTLVLKMNTIRCLRNLFTLFLKAVLEFWLSQISVETLGKIIYVYWCFDFFFKFQNWQNLLLVHFSPEIKYKSSKIRLAERENFSFARKVYSE